MKRLSTIIALALVITIGGVFAAWHYNRGEVSLELTRSATMASIQSDTSKGTIAIDQTANSGNGNTLKFLVDDVDPQDYKAQLVPSGSVYVKFTPAANADASVQTNGIRMKATITVTGACTPYADATHGNIVIFSAKGEGANSFEITNEAATKNSVQITAEQIAGCLVFNEGKDVYLRSYDSNFAYETAMKTYVITITITEVK